MPVSNAKDEGGHAVASTGVGEGLNCLLQFLGVVVSGLVVFLDPFIQLSAVSMESPFNASLLLDLVDCHGVPHHLNHSHLAASGETVVRHHPQVHPLPVPDCVHDGDDLQGQHVLPQVVTVLEDDGVPLVTLQFVRQRVRV